MRLSNPSDRCPVCGHPAEGSWVPAHTRLLGAGRGTWNDEQCPGSNAPAHERDCMRAEDLEYLFSFPIDRVDMECRAGDAPKHCDGRDNRGKLIVLRAFLPLTNGQTAEAVLCAKHMEECVDALRDMMDQGIAKVRREREPG